MSNAEKPYYINKRGNKVFLNISRHAYTRFKERYLIISGKVDFDVHNELVRVFMYADRVKNLSRIEKRRLELHGADTMYFRNKDLTFIVQNAEIVTVEISKKEARFLNKISGDRCACKR